MSKFKVGDEVIGNKLATKHYAATVEGWIGTVVDVRDSWFSAGGYEGLNYDCFDLVQPIQKTLIQKTLIQKTMNAFKKALLSADTKTLIKAGYMDADTLELTAKGQDEIDFIIFEKYKAELVAVAEAAIAEKEA